MNILFNKMKTNSTKLSNDTGIMYKIIQKKTFIVFNKLTEICH